MLTQIIVPVPVDPALPVNPGPSWVLVLAFACTAVTAMICAYLLAEIVVDALRGLYRWVRRPRRHSTVNGERTRP